MIIPCTDTKKPLYNPIGPSDLTVFLIQSKRPVYCLSPLPLPTSAPKLKKKKKPIEENIFFSEMKHTEYERNLEDIRNIVMSHQQHHLMLNYQRNTSRIVCFYQHHPRTFVCRHL